MYSRIIAHRGILDGVYTPYKENDPTHINTVLETTDFDIELDVWFVNDSFYLGHDGPIHRLEDPSVLLNERTWRHAKNVDALIELNKLKDNYKDCFSHMGDNLDFSHLGHNFWHEDDAVVFTDTGIMWVHVDTPPFSGNSVVIVKPEKKNLDKSLLELELFAVCTSIPGYYEQLKKDYYDE